MASKPRGSRASNQSCVWQKKQNRVRCSTKPRAAPLRRANARERPPGRSLRTKADQHTPTARANATPMASLRMRTPDNTRGEPTSRSAPDAMERLLCRPDCAGGIVDRHAHGVAVFGPRAVVILHLIAQELGQGEPAVARALANAAVGNNGLAAVYAHCGVQFL